MQINKIFGFFAILLLPLLTLPPYFFPPDWGKINILKVILSGIFLIFLWQVLFKSEQIYKPSIKNNKIFWVLIGLFVINLLSAIFSVDPVFSFFGSPMRSGGFINFGFYILFSLLLFFIIKKENWQKLFDLSIFTAFIISAIAVIQYLKLFPNILILTQGRPASVLGNPIFLAIYLLLLIFITFSFAINETKIIKKILYFLSTVLFLFVIIITQTRAAILGLLIGIICYFFYYPFKKKIIKIVAGIIITITLISIFTVFTSNTSQRFSVNNIINDNRFAAWKIGALAIKDKLVFGWGQENFQVGFNKFFTTKNIGSGNFAWWDRAHNIIIDTAVNTGILGLICYLALFVALFLEINKAKKLANNNLITLIALQSTLISYFVANLFSFDSFATYLIFFFLIGYILQLNESKEQKTIISFNNLKFKKTIFAIFTIIILYFVWQYSFMPLLQNAKINIAENLVNQKNCDTGLSLAQASLKEKSILKSYELIKYISFVKTCASFYPENNLIYAKKGYLAIKDNIESQPSYSRFYIFWGSFATIMANSENNLQTKNELILQAEKYLNTADQISPNRVEVFLEKIKLDYVKNDFNSAKINAEKCINIDPNFASCYWQKALALIYLKDFNNAEKEIENARIKGFNIFIENNFNELTKAYAFVENFTKLAETYESKIKIDPSNAQLHASLATVYSKIGEYKKAREHALTFLHLQPEAKQEVDDFLKSLPY